MTNKLYNKARNMLNHIGTLYIVATPIGNLQDISIRAAKLLTSAKIIACEDTRHTGLLLDHLRKTYMEHPENAIKPKLVSYYEQNEEKKIPEIIELLKLGEDIVLVSDAGTPSISDPGFTLVREAIKQHIPMTSLPGPSSVILALVLSGLPSDKFSFFGYLPAKSGHAKSFLENLRKSQEYISTTTIFFEAPHKLVGTLTLIKEILGDIEITLCRELTKTYEEILRGRISDHLEHFATSEPRGEFVLLFHL